MQPNGHLCVCVCLCGRLEPCTHTNCTVCIKCEHVCKHMYKLIFYTRHCNRLYCICSRSGSFPQTDLVFFYETKSLRGHFSFQVKLCEVFCRMFVPDAYKQLNPLKCQFEVKLCPRFCPYCSQIIYFLCSLYFFLNTN